MPDAKEERILSACWNSGDVEGVDCVLIDAEEWWLFGRLLSDGNKFGAVK